MVNRMGDCRLAATVWPTSTLRAITTPSTGERMKVFSRSMRRWEIVASFCSTVALEISICAACSASLATRPCTLASACSYVATAWS